MNKKRPSRACRVCRCTFLKPCSTSEGPCDWVSNRLCSTCAPSAVPTYNEVIQELRYSIEILRDSYGEQVLVKGKLRVGKVKDPEILHAIACLNSALKIVRQQKSPTFSTHDHTPAARLQTLLKAGKVYQTSAISRPTQPRLYQT